VSVPAGSDIHSKGYRPEDSTYSCGMSGYPSTLDPAVAAVLTAIREAIPSVAGPSVVGLYLFGSLASGDFDPRISDIDLIAVLTDTPNERLAARLGRMHDDLAQARPDWGDRIEVIYISKKGLANCRTDTTTIGVISPGEPFHLVRAGRDWVLNWYPAREDGVGLIGPPIDTLIPPIPTAEYIEELRRYLADFTNRIDEDATPGWQAYAILSICRGLHTIRFGQRLSKRQAASWAQQEFPRWADLIRLAVGWRDRQRDPDSQDGRATVQETRAFVTEMTKLAPD
jgi:predicted nucleotidyltransferase